MQITIISGRSGSGKSIALDVLEDLGFYCVDNLPIELLPALIEKTRIANSNLAVSIDSRNLLLDPTKFKQIINDFRKQNDSCTICYLDADENTLLERFSETRRKHPLTNSEVSLREAIHKELNLLAPIANMADLTVDTSNLSRHQLCQIIRDRHKNNVNCKLTLLLQSFGFKHGAPANADFVFDVRCLPNPFWEPELRHTTGQDRATIEFLSSKTEVNKMIADVEGFLEYWLPRFEADNRSYITIAFGCTGGQHRSVYITEQIANFLRQKFGIVQVRHRELMAT